MESAIRLEKEEPARLVFNKENAFAYKLLAFMVALGSALMIWRGISISAQLIPAFAVAASLPFMFRLVLPRYGNERTSGVIECVGFIYIQGAAQFLILFPLAEISLPFADASIAAFDGGLGFHWPSFVSMFGPAQYAALEVLYGSFAWQSLLIIPMLFWFGYEARAWRFVTAASFAALICVLVFPFIPAQGPAVHYGLDPADYPLLSGFAWWFGPAIEHFQSGAVDEMKPELLFAMVSVPSYHTVAAVLFTWAIWPIKRARWFFVPLNIGMLVATVVVGTHYLSDLLAGLVVALIMIAMQQVAKPSTAHSMSR